MADLTAFGGELGSRLAALEPLRRRVIRVYWTRGLLALLLLSAAAVLGITAGIASMLWMFRLTEGAQEGQLVARLAPLLLALVVPLALIALGAAAVVVAILRGFRRATVLEYEERFRAEVVAPLLGAALPLAQFDLPRRVEDEAVHASGLFAREERADVSGSLLVKGRCEGVAFAASLLRVRRRGRRLGRRADLFCGLFASIELPGRFDEAILLPGTPGATGQRWPQPPKALQPIDPGDPAFAARFIAYARDARRVQRMLGAPMRAWLLELASRAVAPLCVSFHGGGVTIAIAVPRLLAPRRVRPTDAAELYRQAGLYALLPDAARALAALPF